MSGNFFSAQPGFSGYFGPQYGQQAVIKFSRMNSQGQLAALDQGMFLCESYSITWNRPVQMKHFLNVARPAAIVGYGNGSLSLQGMFGTYEGFQLVTGTGDQEDICNPLVALIQGTNGFVNCQDYKSVASDSTIAWQCYNLVCNGVQVTGSIQDNGTMFQQGSVSFTIGGLTPKRVASSIATMAVKEFEDLEEAGRSEETGEFD